MSVFNSERCFGFLKHQLQLGPRCPGSYGHRKIIHWLTEEMQRATKEILIQRMQWNFRRRLVSFANVVAKFRGYRRQRTVLIGSHFDTRCRADNENDQTLVAKPIPGANDGGSGTAILLELAHVFSRQPPRDDVILAFFDAEDIGDIDGYEYSQGAYHYCANMRQSFMPDEVIVIDMVGGRDMHLDLEVHSFLTPKGAAIMAKLFAIGRTRKFSCFFDNEERAVICDHIPFIDEEIPAVLLIDLNYPQWHTQQDNLEHCDRRSLKMIGQVLLEYLR